MIHGLGQKGQLTVSGVDYSDSSAPDAAAQMHFDRAAVVLSHVDPAGRSTSTPSNWRV